jgi:hypothetical protein
MDRMAAVPPVQPGQLSPDGRWRWNGAQWEPVGVPAGQLMPPRRSKTWIWWVAGGCAVLLVLGLVVAGFGIAGLVRGFQSGAFNCLPSDFPSYPNTTTASFNTSFGSAAAPGDSKRCRIVLESNDDVATVTSFYQQKLNSGHWTITSNDSSTGVISFQLVSRPLTAGTVSLLARGQHTEIQIVLDS